MPGYSTWRTLYHDEYRQLREEGFNVGEGVKPDVASEFLPFPEGVRASLDESQISEADWEVAYHNLWRVREQGQRPDYPYVEPNEYEAIIAEAESEPQLFPLAQAEYVDRIRGAWFGRCAGVVLGKPLEMGYDRCMIRRYLQSVNAYPLNDWVPARSEALDITLRTDCLPSTRGNVRCVQPDDDIHYSVLALLLAEQKGLEFRRLDVGMQLLQEVPIFWLWGAHHQMYWHLVRVKSRPDWEKDQESITDAHLDDMRVTLNPWREWIDGQLKGDVWGYITPGQPRAGARYAGRSASIALVKNGIYGAMFVAGCLSAALSRDPNVPTILAGGLSTIPKRSRLAEAIRSVMTWYGETHDWIATCERIEGRYAHLHYADQVNNLAMVTLALLHGDLDYEKTITTAVMAGIDVDCNGATAGSICGAAIGYDRLPQRWIAPLADTVKTVVASYGQGTISGLAQRTVALHHKLFE
jgi:ADP-ribosylglycohydrolase